MSDRTLVIVAAVAALFVLPSAGRADTICVGVQPAAVACTTSAPSLAAAVTTAAAAPAHDTIRLAAGSYPLAATLTVNTDVAIVGAGESTTTIVTPAGGTTGLLLSDGLATLGDVTLDSNVTSAANQAVTLSGGNSGVTRLDHVTVRSHPGNLGTGIRISGPSTIDNVTVDMPLDTTTIGIQVDGGPIEHTQIRRSRVNARFGVLVQTSSVGILNVDIDRTVIEHNGFGVSVARDITGPSPISAITDTVRITNSVIAATRRVAALGVRSGISAFAGFHAGTGAINGDGVFQSRIDIASSTIIGNSAAMDVAVNVSAFSDTTVTLSFPALLRANITATGTAILGAFRPNEQTVVAGCVTGVANLTCGANAVFRDAFVDPTSRTLVNGGTTTVDATTLDSRSVDPRLVASAPYGVDSDLRPRRDSPLVDAGGTASRTGAFGADVLGNPRPRGAAFDIGANEFQDDPPTAAITDGLGSPVLPGAGVTVVGSVADTDPGDAALASWALPGGATANGSGATFNAPTTPGTYPVTLIATDMNGRTGSVTGLLMVVAPPTATTTFVAVPTPIVDTVRPAVTATVSAITAVAVRAGKPVRVAITSSEPTMANVRLVAVVTRGTRTLRVPLASVTAPCWIGVTRVTMAPNRRALATLARALSARGSRLTALTVTTTNRDVSANVGTATATRRVR